MTAIVNWNIDTSGFSNYLGERGNDTFRISGIDVKMVEIVAESLGFDIKLRLEKHWGIKVFGRWAGIIGAVSSMRHF